MSTMCMTAVCRGQKRGQPPFSGAGNQTGIFWGLVRDNIAVMKYHDQSDLGRKGFIKAVCSYHCWGNSPGAGTQRQSWCRGCGGVLLTGLLGLISCSTRTTSPRVATPIMGWALLHGSLRKCPTGLPAYTYLPWPCRDICFICLVEASSVQMILASINLT